VDGVKLLEVFRDFDVVVKSWTFRPRHNTTKLVVPLQKPRVVTPSDLRRHVQRLQRRFPDRNFTLRRYKGMYVVTRPSYRRALDKDHARKLRAERRKLMRRIPMVRTISRVILLNKIREIDTMLRKRKRIKDRVPIYFDLEAQRFYVPHTYVETQPKLVNYICMVTLGALGVSQSRYVGMKT